MIILFVSVGRKSSVFKMRPTPPAPEIVSMKRPRSAPRSSTLKRKVLMDDTMVLHGEYVLFPMSFTLVTLNEPTDTYFVIDLFFPV